MAGTSTSRRGSTARGGGRTRGRQGASHHDEDEGSSERWLVTYADLLTVLLALFIVLFAISALNESKFEQLKYSLAAVFGDGSVGVLDGSPSLNDADSNAVAQPPDLPVNPEVEDPWIPAVPNLQGTTNADGTSGGATDEQVSNGFDTGSDAINNAIISELHNFDQIRQEIDEHLDEAGLTGAAEYAIDGRGLIVTIVTDDLVFPGNSATLLPRGQKLLEAIVPAVKKVPNNIEVDGYTNQVDVSTYPYPSGWELSSARASSVVRYLESHGLNDRQLSAVGYSDQKPLVDPKDPESVTRNRRVEIVVLSTIPSLTGQALEAAAEAADGEGSHDGASDGSASDGSSTSDDTPEQAARGGNRALHGDK